MIIEKIQEVHIKKRFDWVKKSKPFNNLLDRFGLRNKKVLDLWCAYWEFLIHFGKDSLWITFNDKELEFWIKYWINIEKYNLENDFDMRYNKYDAIFANNIIEHIYSPHKFLLNCRNALHENWIMIIWVPVIALNWLVNKLFKWVYADDHVNFFTVLTIIKTIERAWFEIIDYDLFYFKCSFLNKLLINFIPHVYVIAKKGKLDYWNKWVKWFY